MKKVNSSDSVTVYISASGEGFRERRLTKEKNKQTKKKSIAKNIHTITLRVHFNNV